MSIKTILTFCIAVGLCVFGFVPKSQAYTNIIVLNATSSDITVSCNNTGRLSPGDGGWSCLTARIIVLSNPRVTYTGRDMHTRQGCGGDWLIRYVNDAAPNDHYNVCTHLDIAAVGCNVVTVTDRGIGVEVVDGGQCAGQWFSQHGTKVFDFFRSFATSALRTYGLSR
jgi:hypothetical protein